MESGSLLAGASWNDVDGKLAGFECASIILLKALRDPTRADHQAALTSLESDTSHPDFILHLLEVFAQGGKHGVFSIDIRQLAGLIIKNYVFRHLSELSPDVFSVVKREILNALIDPHHDISNTAGILMGRICDAFSFNSWSDVVEPLVGLLQSTDPTYIHGALNAVKRMCEDACEKLSMDTTIRPLEHIVPCLLELFKSSEALFRLYALESLNSLIFLIPADPEESAQRAGATPCAMITHMNDFLGGLSALSSDSDGRVRRAVCQAIVLLSSHQMAILVPMMDAICSFMLQSILDLVCVFTYFAVVTLLIAGDFLLMNVFIG
jgi:transportin-1